MIYVFLANGFEEMEAMAPIDCLRRAGKQVVTVAVGGAAIRSSHGMHVIPDLTEQEITLDDSLEMIVDKEMWPMPSYGDLMFEV